MVAESADFYGISDWPQVVKAPTSKNGLMFFMTSFLQRIRLAAPYWPGRLPRFDGLDALSESLQFVG